MNSIETIEYKKHYIKVYPDNYDQEGPRQWDNLGILLTHHSNYDFNTGENDQDILNVVSEYETREDIEKELIKIFDPVVIAPVFMYEHGIIRLKIGSFQGLLPQGHAEFDSGQIGYILATKKQVKEEWKVKRISKKLKRTVEQNLEGEIDTLDKWTSGEIYGYATFEPLEKDDDLDDLDVMDSQDSIWGFYDYDYMIKEAKNSIDYRIKYNRKIRQKQVKTLIKNKVPLLKRPEILAV